jgi:small subunit ribosomal protein S19
MTRSTWKIPFSEVVPFFNKTRAEGQAQKVWSRRSVVLPHFVNNSFLVHNGKTFVPIKVSEEMVGHKFGEFAVTRRRGAHKMNRKKQVARK